MDKTINNARNEGETFENYKKRRQQGNKLIKLWLKGRIFHQSTVFHKSSEDDSVHLVGMTYKKEK